METGLTMLFHSVVIGIFLYFFMVFGLGQRNDIAENRSILISAVVLIYMIVFGHGLPTKMNKSL
jgi:hypothetical protein